MRLCGVFKLVFAAPRNPGDAFTERHLALGLTSTNRIKRTIFCRQCPEWRRTCPHPCRDSTVQSMPVKHHTLYVSCTLSSHTISSTPVTY